MANNRRLLNSARLGLRLPPSVLEELRQAADARGVKEGTLARLAITQWLENASGNAQDVELHTRQNERKDGKNKGLESDTSLGSDMVLEGIFMAGFYIENGWVKFADYSRKMIGWMGEAVKPHLKSWYAAVRFHPGIDAQGMDDLDYVEKFALDTLDETERSTASGPEIATFFDVSDMAHDAGFACPVSVHRDVWQRCVEWAEEDNERQCYQEEDARLWDVLFVPAMKIRMGLGSPDAPGGMEYQIYCVLRGEGEDATLITLRALPAKLGDGAPGLVITF